jgi:acetate---CoA ligase (ADP-forming)
MTSRTQDLQRLIDPRHVAFVGGRSLVGAIRACEALGYEGQIWVVNPTLDEVAGYRCVPTVADLPQPPDAAFVGVRRELAIDAVRELAEHGAGGCVCLAAGFAELGADGEVWQQRLVEAAGGMPVIGPNCYGMLNYVDGVALWPDLHGGTRTGHGVALVSQSGNISLNATMADRALPLSHVFSIGNQAVLGVGDYVDALLDDPRVHAIGLYVEGIPDLPGFRSAAERALGKGVPLVALKAGTHALTAPILANHTGSDAGHPVANAELFAELGVTQVATLPELLETLKVLSVWRDRAGPALALVTASGGDSAMVADLALASGLEFPPFDDRCASDLHAQLGELVVVANPLDYNTVVWGDRPGLERCFETVMQASFDAVLLVLDHPREGTGDPTPWRTAAEAFVAAHRTTGCAAAVLSTLPELMPAAVGARLMEAGVVPLQGAREAVVALAAGARYASRRHQLLGGDASGQGHGGR